MSRLLVLTLMLLAALAMSYLLRQTLGSFAYLPAALMGLAIGLWLVRTKPGVFAKVFRSQPGIPTLGEPDPGQPSPSPERSMPQTMPQPAAMPIPEPPALATGNLTQETPAQRLEPTTSRLSHLTAAPSQPAGPQPPELRAARQWLVSALSALQRRRVLELADGARELRANRARLLATLIRCCKTSFVSSSSCN